MLSNRTNGQLPDLDSLAFNGYYKELLELKCDHYPKRPERDPATDISFIKMMDDNFVNQIANEKIIIINESHLHPQNRAYTYSILKKLFKKPNQYYVFFEALNSNGNILNKKSLPNINEQGYYFQEPQMAENLRLVLSNKHNAYAYEELSDVINFNLYRSLQLNSNKNDSLLNLIVKNSTGSDKMINSMNIRDLNQFLNFYKNYKEITRSNPSAQFIIIVGHGHINEFPTDGFTGIWYPFACILRNMMNINPCTVEFTEFNPVCKSDRNPFYNIIYNKVPDPDKYYYMTNMDLYNHQSEIGKTVSYICNYFILSPVPKYTDNRPDWLLQAGRQAYTIPNIKFKQLKTGTTIKAVYINENNTSTPADIIYYNPKINNTLFLFPGTYKILDNENNILISNVHIKA
jgi:hypothetical protein